MSHDSWGGGSDADPKLRLKETERLAPVAQRMASVKVPAKPRFSVAQFLLWVAIGVVAFAAYKLAH